MNQEELIDAFVELGEVLSRPSSPLDEAIRQSYLHNNWFTEENSRLAIDAIVKKFLQKEKLNEWLDKYDFPKQKKEKNIGLVMAGNIPLVGFHDFLCVLLSGNIAQIKLSSKDKFLLPFLVGKLSAINPAFKKKIYFVELLKKMDAVIATGSNNSSRYFEYYFGKYPHIIRKHRNSAAVLSGRETSEELKLLGKDIFHYFGMGCRSVSKLFVPLDYDFKVFFPAIESFKSMIEHHKYKNNYDYNSTLLLMNKTPHLTNNFLILVENKEMSSPIATLYYEHYKNEKELSGKLKASAEKIQCIVSHTSKQHIPFGQSQYPELWDYADGVDVMKFMKKVF